MSMREVKLPSGAVLSISASPFAAAKALYQAVLRELKHLSIDATPDMPDLYKNAFCVGFSSPEIEACLWECFKRCLYNGVKIDADTFEPVQNRDDYMKVCVEVAKENVGPFAKSLYAEYSSIRAMVIGSSQESKSQTTSS